MSMNGDIVNSPMQIPIAMSVPLESFDRISMISKEFSLTIDTNT